MCEEKTAPSAHSYIAELDKFGHVGFARNGSDHFSFALLSQRCKKGLDARQKILYNASRKKGDLSLWNFLCLWGAMRCKTTTRDEDS